MGIIIVDDSVFCIDVCFLNLHLLMHENFSCFSNYYTALNPYRTSPTLVPNRRHL